MVVRGSPSGACGRDSVASNLVVMGNVAALFGPPPQPNPSSLPEIPSRKHRRTAAGREPEKDISVLVLEAKAKVERFELLRLNAENAAAAIWKDAANHKIPHKKKEAMGYMLRVRQANQNIDMWMNQLSYLQKSEAALTSAETQKHITDQMRQMKMIAARTSQDMPDIEDVAALKEDIDDMMTDFGDQNSAFSNLFTEPTDTFELLTSEEEEELMDGLDSLVAPKQKEEDPPDNPGAGAEKVTSVTEEDLDRLLDAAPAIPSRTPKREEGIPSGKPKRKVALML